MFNPSDLNFGVQPPSLTGNGWSGYGVAMPSDGALGFPAGASAPVTSYLQTSASSPTLSAAAPAVGAAAPAAAAGGGLGFNMDTGKLILGGLQTIGSLWQAWEANKLARDQFKFSKDFANTNLANQIRSYNTQVEDIGRSRAFTESQSVEEAAAWLKANRLPSAKI